VFIVLYDNSKKVITKSIAKDKKEQTGTIFSKQTQITLNLLTHE
jgi:hypothetical protein